MKKVLIAIGIVSSIGLMIFFNLIKDSGDFDGIQVFNGKVEEVEAEVIQKGEISSTVLISGTVEEVNMKSIVSTSTMELVDVLVEKGDQVAKGDVLFTVDIDSMEDELLQLELNREIQALQLEKLKNVSASSSSTGAKVSVEVAKLNLASATTMYENQLETYEKNQALFDEGIISKTELDASEKSAEDAKQQVAIAELNLERSESDLSQIFKENNTSSKSLGYDVQIQLKNLESLDLNIAELEKQMSEIAENTKSPISGVVTDVYVNEGDIVMGSTPLMEIVDTDNLVIKADVREYDIRDMAIGQNAVITGDAIPKDAEVAGKIEFIAPIASDAMVNGRQTTGIEIHIAVTKGLEYLKPGYTTDCEITTKHLTDVVVANYSLFREDKDNNKYVFVVVDGIVEEREIETGITSDFEAQITSGLEAGDMVIINPSLAIQDGMRVKITNNLEEEGK